MKLHDIVELRKTLGEFSTEGVDRELDMLASNLAIVKDRCNEDYSFRLGEILKSIDGIKQSLGKPISQLGDVGEIIKKDLADATEKFFLPNYQDELRYSSPDNIREIRNLYIPNGVDDFIRKAIDLHVDWRYPALEIGCRDGDYTKFLVGCDPLYIADVHQEFLDSTIGNYTEEYQRRLRPYLITDMDVSMLPHNQFGFVFSWNFFNYLSMDSIHKYLQQIMTLLRPGGVFMFSYNKADMPAGAAYADSYFMSYAPKSMLLPMCERIGFEIKGSADLEPAVSWVELRKPGELKMIKSHQVLGEIKWVNP